MKCREPLPAKVLKFTVSPVDSFFRQMMQVKADEIADLLAFHINNANRFSLPDQAGRALGRRNVRVSFVSHAFVLLATLCT